MVGLDVGYGVGLSVVGLDVRDAIGLGVVGVDGNGTPVTVYFRDSSSFGPSKARETSKLFPQ